MGFRTKLWFKLRILFGATYLERLARSGLLLTQVSVLRTENDLKIILTERLARSGLLFAQVSVLRTENDLKIISTERFARSGMYGAACCLCRCRFFEPRMI